MNYTIQFCDSKAQCKCRSEKRDPKAYRVWHCTVTIGPPATSRPRWLIMGWPKFATLRMFLLFIHFAIIWSLCYTVCGKVTSACHCRAPKEVTRLDNPQMHDTRVPLRGTNLFPRIGSLRSYLQIAAKDLEKNCRYGACPSVWTPTYFFLFVHWFSFYSKGVLGFCSPMYYWFNNCLISRRLYHCVECGWWTYPTFE